MSQSYQMLRAIVDQLPQTKQREAQWAEIRPDPPRHMNLALEPRPRHFGRLCRFRVGDAVRPIYECSIRRVATVECPEVNPVGWSHCQGSDAIYTLDDGRRLGDIELAFAEMTEMVVLLKSGRRVRVTMHLGRMIALVDEMNGRPLGAEDVSADDWEYLFFNRLPDYARRNYHA